MPEIILSIPSHTALVLFALPLAILVAFWAYRRTTPAVSTSMRFFLAGLRGATLLVLVLILGEPVLSFLSRTEEPPETLVLIDNSGSMQIQDSFEDRRSATGALLSSGAIGALQSIGSARFVQFDRHARPVEVHELDSLTFDGDVTDIAEALRFVQREARTQNIRAVVLVSDGMVTEGGNPVYELEALGLPIYTVGVGDTSARRDVRIHTVLTNSVAYVDTRIPVAIDVRSQGYAGVRTEILLRSSEGILDRKILDLAAGSRRYDIGLSLNPKTPGMHRYTVEISAPTDDAVPANNRLSFYVKVLDSKLNVLLIAGAPSADVAFIRRSLEGDETLTVGSYIQRLDGMFTDGPLLENALEEADCVIMVGYPTARSAREPFENIIAAVRNGKGLLTILGRTTDLGKLSELGTELPGSITGLSAAEQEVFLSVVAAERMNPLVRGTQESDAIEYWQRLAPVIRRDARIVPRPESKVLLVARYQNVQSTDPIYLSRSVGGRKGLLLGAYGLWLWKMHAAENVSDPLAHFLDPALRWLSSREEEKPLRVRPVKEVFSGQESVELDAQLYDATFQPVDDADVRVKIAGNGAGLEVFAQPMGSGRYTAIVEGLGEGSYSYSARASADDLVLGTDQGSFSIGQLTVEYQDVRPNRVLLEQLAERSGGKYFRADEPEGLAERIARDPQFRASAREQARTVELWNAPWVLLLLVVLLALEWGLRKRSGML